MIKFILIILIYDPHTLELLKIFDPIPGYETEKDCQVDALARIAHEQFPPGSAVYMKCMGAPAPESMPQPEIF